jgi:hypothetical protein
MEKTKLILDFGNTRWKLALFRGKEMVELKIVDSNKPGEALSWIRALPKYAGCMMSTVVEVPSLMLQLLKQKGGFHELNEKTALPIRNLYLSPASLGKDRLAAATGAGDHRGYLHYPRNHYCRRRIPGWRNRPGDTDALPGFTHFYWETAVSSVSGKTDYGWKGYAGFYLIRGFKCLCV